MADVSGRKGKKRRVAVKAMAAKTPCKPSETPTQSSSLLLGIPTDTNTSLPVWDAMRSQQVDVTWTVSPYSVIVHLTPVTMKPEDVKASCLQLNTSNVSVTLIQNSVSPPCSTASIPCLPATITSKAVPESPPSKLQAQPKAPTPMFFTKNSADVLICDDFLLGLCQKEEKCLMHHTPYPFHWQLWAVSTHQWTNLPPRSQVLLERIYCDVHSDDIELKDGGVTYQLDFDSMELNDLTKYVGVRRLTNSDCANKNQHFPSKWKIYWNGDENYEEYKADLSALLLKTMREKKKTCSFQMGTQTYMVDFLTMTQTNVTTGYQRDVRYRPVYRSPLSMQSYLRTGILSDLTPPDPVVLGANFNVDPLEKFTSWYPPAWSRASAQDYSLVDVPVGTLVYQRVSDTFHESLPETKMEIICIQQIQNLFQWDKYQRQKTHMQQLHTKSEEPLERHLFHGTSASASESICRGNFDPRLAGVNGASHGYGSYFATKAWISDGYTDVMESASVRHIFLAKVLVGRVTVGKQRYRRPPAFNPKTQPHAFYDACVDKKDNPSMFVVYDSCQCYPYYLIKYKTLPTEIPISE